MVVGSGRGKNRIALHASQAIMPCVGQFYIGNLNRIGQEEGGIEMQINFNGTITPMNGREGVCQDSIGVIIFALIPNGSPYASAGIEMLMHSIFRCRPNGEA